MSLEINCDVVSIYFRSFGSNWFAKINFAETAHIKRIHYSLDDQILVSSPRTSMFLRKFSKASQNSLGSLLIEQLDYGIISSVAICKFFQHLEPSLNVISNLELDFKGCTSTIFEHPFLTQDFPFLENLKLTTRCILITKSFLHINSSRIRKVKFDFDWNTQVRNRNAEECIVEFLQCHRMTIACIDISIEYPKSSTIGLPSNLKSLDFPMCQSLNFKGLNIWFSHSPISQLIDDILVSKSVQNVTLDSEIMLYVLRKEQICHARTVRLINYNENHDLHPILDLKIFVAKFPHWQNLNLKKIEFRNSIELQNPKGMIRLEGFTNLNYETLNDLLLVAKNTDIRFEG